MKDLLRKGVTLSLVALTCVLASAGARADDGNTTGAGPCAAGACVGSSDVVTQPVAGAGTKQLADVGISADNSGQAAGQADECVITSRQTTLPCFKKDSASNSLPITAAHTQGLHDQLYHGAKIEAGVTSSVPIDVFGVCRYVDKGSLYGRNSIFIPFDTVTEWTNFTKAFDPGNTNSGDKDVLLTKCVRGGWVDLPANLQNLTPANTAAQVNQCNAPQVGSSSQVPALPQTINPQVHPAVTPTMLEFYLPYERWVPAVTSQTISVVYTCASADGLQHFNETVTGTANVLNPQPKEQPLAAKNAVPPMGWALDTANVKVDYAGICGPATGTGASPPTTGLCSVGVATAPIPNTSGPGFNWQCQGGNGSGSTTVSCPPVGACNPSTVANGTVGAAPACTIACNTGYTPSADGKSCVVADPVGCCSSCPDYGTSIGCIYLPTTQSACPTQISNGWTSQIWSSASCGFSCNPSTVANGTVNADCSITCDTANGYKLSADGKSCQLSSGDCTYVNPRTGSTDPLGNGTAITYGAGICTTYSCCSGKVVSASAHLCPLADSIGTAACGASTTCGASHLSSKCFYNKCCKDNGWSNLVASAQWSVPAISGNIGDYCLEQQPVSYGDPNAGYMDFKIFNDGCVVGP